MSTENEDEIPKDAKEFKAPSDKPEVKGVLGAMAEIDQAQNAESKNEREAVKRFKSAIHTLEYSGQLAKMKIDQRPGDLEAVSLQSLETALAGLQALIEAKKKTS